MSKKCTIEVTQCSGCPHFDNEYYSYNETCMLLKKKISYKDRDEKIPEECPLPNWEQ